MQKYYSWNTIFCLCASNQTPDSLFLHHDLQIQKTAEFKDYNVKDSSFFYLLFILFIYILACVHLTFDCLHSELIPSSGLKRVMSSDITITCGMSLPAFHAHCDQLMQLVNVAEHMLFSNTIQLADSSWSCLYQLVSKVPTSQ